MLGQFRLFKGRSGWTWPMAGNAPRLLKQMTHGAGVELHYKDHLRGIMHPKSS